MQVEDDCSDSAESRSPFLWLKVADPDFVVPVPPPGTDVRVLVPAGERFARLRDELRAKRIPFRDVGYLLEHEIIGNLTASGVTTAVIGSQNAPSRQSRPLAGAAAEAARDGFEYMWHDHLTDHAAPERGEQFINQAHLVEQDDSG